MKTHKYIFLTLALGLCRSEIIGNNRQKGYGYNTKLMILKILGEGKGRNYRLTASSERVNDV